MSIVIDIIYVWKGGLGCGPVVGALGSILSTANKQTYIQQECKTSGPAAGSPLPILRLYCGWLPETEDQRVPGSSRQRCEEEPSKAHIKEVIQTFICPDSLVSLLFLPLSACLVDAPYSYPAGSSHPM